MRKRWIKLWTQETLYGTTSKELEPAERWVWLGFLALAGDSIEPGKIQVAPGIPWTDTQLARLLDVPINVLQSAKKRMIEHDKITINSEVITIANWDRYQSEYDRTKKYKYTLSSTLKTTSKQKVDNSVEELQQKVSAITDQIRTDQNRGEGKGGENPTTQPLSPIKEETTKWFPYNDKYKTYYWCRKDHLGYILLSKCNPPGINKHDVLSEHQWLWINERGQIPDGFVIHHINGIRDDNRIENLKLLTRQEHIRVTKQQIRRRFKEKQVLPPEPEVKKILDTISQKVGYQIPNYAKEGTAAKRALKMGFSSEQFIACWEKMKTLAFWKGKWLPFAKVTENLGEFVAGRLEESKRGLPKAKKLSTEEEIQKSIEEAR